MATKNALRFGVTSMLLRDFLGLFAQSRDVSSGYIDQLHWAIHGLEKFVGKRLRTTDLTPDLLNTYLRWMRDNGHTTETRKGRRKNLLILWRAAADMELAAEPPARRVMRIRHSGRITVAWSYIEACILLEFASKLTGSYSNGIQRSHYWTSYIRAAWDSGLRGCDLRSLERDWVAPHGRLVVIQGKTRKRVVTQFRRSTLDSIAMTFPPERAIIWPLWASLDRWRREAKKLVRRAGLVGSIGRLRHSSGTATELTHPGRGHEHLGNTRKIFEEHYLDHHQIANGAVLPMPPELPPAA
jgi:hypothetical protein